MHLLDLLYHFGTMRLFFRLLLWLSITVLSFQGGTAMAFGEAEVPAQEAMVATGHQHHQAAEQSGEDHCSKHDSETAASAHAKCAACAICCVGSVAPPGLTSIFHAPQVASSPHATPEATMTSFVPSTLERPPRALFV